MDRVERLAHYGHRWTDGFLELKFSHFRWKDKATGTLTLFDDKIEIPERLWSMADARLRVRR